MSSSKLPTNSNLFTKKPAAPDERVRRAASSIDPEVPAYTPSLNGMKRKRSVDDATHEKSRLHREHSTEDHKEKKLKQEPPHFSPNDQQSSSNESINENSGQRAKVRPPLKPIPDTKYRAKQPQAQLRPAGYKPPNKQPTIEELIVISSDEDESEDEDEENYEEDPRAGPANSDTAKQSRAQLRPAGCRLPENQATPENVIVISSDEDDDEEHYKDAREVWDEHKQAPMTGIIPRDSHQDDTIVNSIETESVGAAVGVDHYLELLNQHKTYDNISVDFTSYRTNGKDPKDLPNLDHGRDVDDLGPLDAGIDYTRLPESHRGANLCDCIYRGFTYNPLIALAIIRIAQKNMPFINLDSALEHLPNLGPTEPFPTFPEDLGFLDDTDYQRKPSDKHMRTVFFPRYFADERHVIGYYIRNPNGRLARLFTPCTDADLYRYGLIGVLGEDYGNWEDTRVGGGDGQWYHRMRETDAWSILWGAVYRFQEEVLDIIMGGKEEDMMHD